MEMEYRLKGWPAEKEQVDELAREYWNFREELNVEMACYLHQTEL